MTTRWEITRTPVATLSTTRLNDIRKTLKACYYTLDSPTRPEHRELAYHCLELMQDINALLAIRKEDTKTA